MVELIVGTPDPSEQSEVVRELVTPSGSVATRNISQTLTRKRELEVPWSMAPIRAPSLAIFTVACCIK